MKLSLTIFGLKLCLAVILGSNPTIDECEYRLGYLAEVAISHYQTPAFLAISDSIPPGDMSCIAWADLVNDNGDRLAYWFCWRPGQVTFDPTIGTWVPNK